MNRREAIKGTGLVALLGLVGVSLREMTDPKTAVAARRPTPTPRPVKCPGIQEPVGGVCVCPPDQPNHFKCGPTCCFAANQCCDNACCGTGFMCDPYNEEHCIPV